MITMPFLMKLDAKRSMCNFLKKVEKENRAGMRHFYKEC